MTIHEIQNRNYAATMRRGKITPSTSRDEFLNKLLEEVEELIISTDSQNQSEEMADVILVLLAMAKHMNIDIMNELRKKVIKNETRND